MLGAAGLKEVSECAVLNANYVRALLQDTYGLTHRDSCMHEVVLDGTPFKEQGIRTLDVAKRMLDFGVHAPTVYFPLVVHAALMIEPTETESKETLDEFIAAMRQIDEESKASPGAFMDYPRKTFRRWLDDVAAARTRFLRWKPEK